MNTRANIMYFVEHLLEMASKERHNDYVRMMQRDMFRVVDAVCPSDGSGAANVKVVRTVLNGLHSKSILLKETVTELEQGLKERDTSANDVGLSSPVKSGSDNHKNDSNSNHNNNSKAADTNGTGARNGGGSSSSKRPDKRQIEQRIEEDRERHKRMRESMWVVPSDIREQARKFFDETSDLGEDDHILGEEEMAQCIAEYEEQKCRHLRNKSKTNGASKH
ncbi:CTD kinase subunit gamma CTK3-domain-containing protein [Xylariaceae sp. FL0804]|nr:CTD kinase subunit gamma CTK3-domain-containing protein [Xylariaceae sp. FL0804]